jgi:diaminopimelate decarboxylase
MSYAELLERRDGALWLEEVPVTALAERFGTPLYAYSRAGLIERADRLDRAFGAAPHLVAYAIKANLNLAVARTFVERGCGVDVTSRGELERALVAGAEPARIVYSGVGKRADEIDRALGVGIRMFNAESMEELEALDARARALGTTAPISFRLNPDVDPQTHPHISTGLRTAKFGIPIEEAPAAYAKARALTGIRIVGVDCHIGSQLTALEPIRDALRRLREAVLALRADGHRIELVDVGGGLGVEYSSGRRFVIVDGGMNDLLRPALYDAEMRIETDPLRPGRNLSVDVVGPVCESVDRFARDRELPPVERGDLLVVRDAGAYSFAMASTYNGRPLAAEVMVHGARHELVRRRQTLEETWTGERIPEWDP